MLSSYVLTLLILRRTINSFITLILICLKQFCHVLPVKIKLYLLLAGFLRDKLGNYDLAFYLAGVPPIIGGLLLCLIPWVEAHRRRKDKEAQGREQGVDQKMMEHQAPREDDKNKDGDSVL